MIQFLVKGSSTTPYTVTFTLEGGNLSAFCTCMAGKNGQYCKHRMSILRGEVDALVSDNKDDVSIVRSWLEGSDVELAIHDIAEAQHYFDEAQKKLLRAKKALARAMHE